MPRSSNYTYTQSYHYTLTPFTLFVHNPSHGSYHHPFTNCRDSPDCTPLLQEMQLPQLCLPPCCSQNSTDATTAMETPREMSLHPEVGSLRAAPALPAHCCVVAPPGSSWCPMGRLYCPALGRGWGVPGTLSTGTDPHW